MDRKVIVGMSGGVDSAVSAYLLKSEGYQVIGLFMRNWKETNEGVCTAEEDYTDVRRICQCLEIPYYTVDFSEEYFDRVFRLFIEEYREGRTPNPDVLCNSEIKFNSFREYAFNMGADYIATGHYARLRAEGEYNYLLRAKDESKDQTYFLNQLSNEQLSKVIFPIGGLNKVKVREIARQAGIPIAEKKDSTGICFIGEKKMLPFLSDYIPMKKGIIKTINNKEVGEHSGVFYYTIGQRRGLNIGGKSGGNGGRWFVVDKDAINNILYVSEGEIDILYKKELTLTEVNFIPDNIYGSNIRVQSRIRHRQPLQDARLELREEGWKLIFDEPVRAPAAGQYAVMYIGEICIGGGKIIAAS